ncbi:hypothetical protein V2P20_12265 [Methylobacter sp. Wu1]|uniref:hypothetical protein n=1 Tax=Methylobacter sp. Wu1 TaxID=3119359 RepID=UPI002F92FC62
MTNIILENLNLFPHWLQTTLLIAWGGFLFLLPIHGIIKIIQSNSMLSFFRSIPGLASKCGKFLQHQIDDPIKFPRIERFLQYVMVVQSYLLSFTLFLYFSLILLLLAFTEKQLSLLQHAGILCFCLLCAYMGAVLKTQGSRELLKIRAHTNA